VPMCVPPPPPWCAVKTPSPVLVGALRCTQRLAAHMAGGIPCLTTFTPPFPSCISSHLRLSYSAPSNHNLRTQCDTVSDAATYNLQLPHTLQQPHTTTTAKQSAHADAKTGDFKQLLCQPRLHSHPLIHQQVRGVIQHALCVDHSDLRIIHQQPRAVGLPHVSRVVAPCRQAVTHTRSECIFANTR